MVEATAVSAEGRITPRCAGLWNEKQCEALVPIVRSINAEGAAAGIQLGHAGPKGSAHLPWEGGALIPDDAPGGWQALSASSIRSVRDVIKVSKEMTKEDISRVQSDFASAAVRARQAGFEWLELHFAHGYLAMSFLSKYLNERNDEYGGTLENRGRFLLETIAAVREVWPASRPLAVRLGMVEFDGHDKEHLAESIELAKRFKDLGVDLMDVSIGLSTPTPDIPWATPGFLVPVAQRVRCETGMPVMSSFRLDSPEIAERAVSSEQLDLIAIAKGMLSNPHWPYHAARKLGIEKPSWTLPAQYAYWLERYVGSE